MKNIIQLNYPLDKVGLLKDAELAREAAVVYTDSRNPHFHKNEWKIKKYTSPLIEKMMEDLNILHNGKPRFYFLAPNFTLPRHVDNNTTCSFNFVLSDDPAPVSFDEEDVLYYQGLLNTTVHHWVRNGPKERILFKISIFDTSFEEMAKTLKYVL